MLKQKPTHLVGPDGNEVPIKMIKPDKVAEHDLTTLIIGDIVGESDRLDKLRDKIWKRIETYQRKKAKQKGYNYNPALGITLTSYDQLSRVVVQRKSIEKPNDNLAAAKEFAKKCIWRWSKKNSDGFLKEVVDKTFNISKKGFIDVKMLRRLQEIEFNDRDWKRFKEMINESIDVVETRRYIMFQVRESIDSDWQTIKLTFRA